MDETAEGDTFTPEKQEARCFLRERFLRAVGSVVGKECTFDMYSNTTVTGIFRGSDIEFNNILVDNLKTPTGILQHSIVRSGDLHCISIDKFVERS